MYDQVPILPAHTGHDQGKPHVGRRVSKELIRKAVERALITGFFLGFILASPLGPMGLICLRRTLTQGPTSGFTSALGISCADAFWAYVAIHGLTTVSNWIEQEKIILEIAIALFFILYGLHGIFNTPSTYYPTLQNKDKAAGFLSTFLVVFLNPSTFIAFAILFTLFGITNTHYGFFNSVIIASSVFAGSIVFWFALTQILHRVRKRINESIYGTMSRISSYVIMVFGIIILIIDMYDILFKGGFI